MDVIFASGLQIGVLDYDVTADKKIIFTNGRYVFLFDGTEKTVLFKEQRIDKVRIKT